MKHRGNILQLGIKELRSLWRDKALLLFVAFAFTGLIYVVSSATSQELNNAPIAVVDEDQSPLSKRIINAFYGPYFKTPDIITLPEVDPAMDNGSYTFVINIPPYFERDVLAGKQPDLQVNIDATRMTQAFIGDGYIQNIIGTEINEFVKGYRATYVYPVQLTSRIKFNPNLTSVWFGSVMELMNVITMISIILTGAAVIREREHGTLEHLLVMPLTPFEIVVAKIWANGLVILLAAAFSLFVVIEGFLHVPIHGSAALFLFGAAIHLFATTSLGILLGTQARTMPQLGLLIILILLPLQMLSGGITPRESMPDIVQNIMLVAPTTHFVKFAQAILYRGAGWEVVWPYFLALLAIGTVFFLFALARFRKSVAQS
ncbi:MULTISPECIES: ABC transporter permease [unclassified Cocleimonas]|jgi:ABC-2 type transport system permease protein|uniref:ABC transporter permease n=1 Tax=unclassified Cocleimonas TaxID=2639732 RepID=UPI00261F5E21|nr:MULTISPECIES: ABC transporter permease [unclassified Cocleimonas]MEB8434403.1 ABC transporter permease [Cocleimonas sp. KMM 6892]MEC4717194.1 ABC transporter permease [Cocleimonas sp. KMM 6895]MEC4746573.1 ABC transporter permease [Cocleimonas sp. KMM 6896]